MNLKETDIKTKLELKFRLKTFFEAYHRTKILDATEDGIFKTHILLSKNKNKTPKEKLINYKLLRLMEYLFDVPGEDIPIKNLIISEFLIEELIKYVQKSVK